MVDNNENLISSSQESNYQEIVNCSVTSVYMENDQNGGLTFEYSWPDGDFYSYHENGHDVNCNYNRASIYGTPIYKTNLTCETVLQQIIGFMQWLQTVCGGLFRNQCKNGFNKRWSVNHSGYCVRCGV